MLLLGLLASLALAQEKPAACAKPAEKSNLPFGAKQFGGPYVPGPECDNYREAASNPSVGLEPAPAEPEPQPEPPREDAPAPPALPAPVVIPAPPGVPQPRAEARPSNAPRWSWPGPRSAPRKTELAKADTDPFAAEDEALRDAPAPLPAERYSLWAGLSQPLLLPAAKVRGASADQAHELGRRDYDSHILSRPGVKVPEVEGKTLSAPADPTRKRVEVELEVSGPAGDYSAAAGELARAAGFSPEPGWTPRVTGKRVVLAGTVEADRAPELLGVDGVKKVVSADSPAAAAAEAETALLIGIRIPEGGSPTAALAEAAERLSAGAGFVLDKPLATQQVPGTDQLVVVAAGRVPVRSMGRLLADPAVAKVAPLPARARPAAAPAEPAWKGLLRRAVREQPVMLLAAVLFCVAFSGPFLRRRRPLPAE